MPSEQLDEINRQTDLALLESIRQQIWEHLDSEKRRIYTEIRYYPPPIPACDLQFNYLLEERAKIYQELGRVEAIPKQCLLPGDYLRWIEEFITSSAYMTGEIGQSIRCSLATLNGADGGVANTD